MKKGSAKSIRAVLKNIADKEKIDFQLIVIRYLHERLLFRIANSAYVNNFFLKGGSLLYAIEGLHTRPTMDIDMLAKYIIDDKKTLENIFKNICSIKYNDDCVNFDAANIIATDIAEEKKYSGIRLQIKSQFDTIKQIIQIDIGFGDVIIPAPVMISYPAMLQELDSPDIMAYSIETVIAEKFHAMIALGVFNSRMKDFFDVYVLIKNRKINNESLCEAILQTFRRRDTDFTENHELFSASFCENQNRNTMWNAFLRKIKHPENLDFPHVMKTINERLYPIYLELKNNTNK